MNQDELFLWEEEAQNALALADFDDIRGVISLPKDEIKLQHWGEFNNVDDLRYRLEEIYDSAWYAHVPFESGEAVFDGDSTGFVIDVIGDRGIEEFFEAIAPPQQSKK